MAQILGLLDRLLECDLLSQDQRDELVHWPESRDPDPRSLARALVQRKWLTLFQINQIGSGRARELRVGPYILEERLGEGGMGQVFKARHQHMNRVVALKVIRREKLNNDHTVKRFYQEIQATAQLHHPNIVIAFDAGQTGQMHYFAMEYVEGIDLARFVKDKGPLPVATACDYIRQAALGLQHAHERGLVHRDIKPANLLVDRKGVVKILDMGLARLGDNFQQERGLTKVGQVIGTPDYLAPEQALDATRVDIRADLYSLGCSLYFLLTGHPPYTAESLAELLLKHQIEEPIPVRDHRTDVPAELVAILDRMLAKKPAERFSTPEEVAELLDSFVRGAVPTVPPLLPASRSVDQANLFADLTDAGAGVVVSPRRDHSRTREDAEFKVKKPRRRDEESSDHKKIYLFAGIGGGVALLLIGILVAVLALGGRKEDPDGRQSNQTTKKDNGKEEKDRDAKDQEPKDQEPKDQQPKDKEAKNKDGQRPGPADKDRDKGKQPPDKGQPVKVPVAPLGEGRLLATHAKGAVRALVVTSKGTLAVSAGGDKSINLYDLKTGKILHTFANLHASAATLALAADDKNLLASLGTSVVEFDLDEKKEVGKPRRGAGGHLSPDGKKSVRPFSADNMEYWRIADTTQAERVELGRVLRKGGGVQRMTFSPDSRRAFTAVRGTKLDEAGVIQILTLDKPVSVFDLVLFPLSLQPTVAIQGRNENEIIAGFSDGGVRLIELNDKRIKQTFLLVQHDKDTAVTALALSSDGKELLSGGKDQTVRLTSLELKRVLGGFTRQRGEVTCVAFIPGSRQALAASANGEVWLWDFEKPEQRPVKPDPIPVPKPKPAEMFVGHKGAVNAVAWSPDGKYIAAGGDVVRVWDAATGKVQRLGELEKVRGRGEPGEVRFIRFSPSGKFLLAGGAGKVSAVWNTQTWAAEGIVFNVAKQDDGAAGGDINDSKRCAVAAWKVVVTEPLKGKGRPTIEIMSPEATLTSVCWQGATNLLVGDAKGVVRVYATSGVLRPNVKPIFTYTAHKKGTSVLAIAYHAKTHQVVTAGADKTLTLRSGKVWVAKTPKRFPGHEGPVTCVVFSADGKRLLTGSKDKTVRLWDIAQLKQIGKWDIKEAVNGVTIDPTGKKAACCTENGIKIIDLTKPAKQ